MYEWNFTQPNHSGLSLRFSASLFSGRKWWWWAIRGGHRCGRLLCHDVVRCSVTEFTFKVHKADTRVGVFRWRRATAWFRTGKGKLTLWFSASRQTVGNFSPGLLCWPSVSVGQWNRSQTNAARQPNKHWTLPTLGSDRRSKFTIFQHQSRHC